MSWSVPVILGTVASGISAVVGYFALRDRFGLPGGDSSQAGGGVVMLGGSREREVAAFARRHGVDRQLLEGIIRLESSGVPLVKGRPVIRVELHLVRKYSKAARRRVQLSRGPVWEVDGWMRHDVSKVWTRQTVLRDGSWVQAHPRGSVEDGQAQEWWTFQEAVRRYGESVAVQSASWGLGQVMGFHWRRLGFPSPAAFRKAQATEAGQVQTFLRMVETEPGAIADLKDRNLAGFVAKYNGEGQVDYYLKAWKRQQGVA